MRPGDNTTPQGPGMKGGVVGRLPAGQEEPPVVRTVQSWAEAPTIRVEETRALRCFVTEPRRRVTGLTYRVQSRLGRLMRLQSDGESRRPGWPALGLPRGLGASAGLGTCRPGPSTAHHGPEQRGGLGRAQPQPGRVLGCLLRGYHGSQGLRTRPEALSGGAWCPGQGSLSSWGWVCWPPERCPSGPPARTSCPQEVVTQDREGEGPAVCPQGAGEGQAGPVGAGGLQGPQDIHPPGRAPRGFPNHRHAACAPQSPTRLVGLRSGLCISCPPVLVTAAFPNLRIFTFAIFPHKNHRGRPTHSQHLTVQYLPNFEFRRREKSPCCLN